MREIQRQARNRKLMGAAAILGAIAIILEVLQVFRENDLACGPLEVVFTETGHNRSSAGQREAAIKKLSRDSKLRLILENAAMLK